MMDSFKICAMSLMILPTVFIVSCASDVPEISPVEKPETIFEPLSVYAERIDSVSTRTNVTSGGSSWTIGDKIGISCYTASGSELDESSPMKRYTNYDYKYATVKYEDGSTGNKFIPGSQGYIYFSDNQTYGFRAYYPYAGISGSLIGTIPIDTSISQDDVAKARTMTFLYADVATASKVSSVVEFTGDASFKHLMTKVVILLTYDLKLDTPLNEDHIGWRLFAQEGGNPVGENSIYKETAQEYLSECRFLISGLRHKGEYKVGNDRVLLQDGYYQPVIDGWDIIDKGVAWDPKKNESNIEVLMNLYLLPQKVDNLKFTLVDKYGKTYHSSPTEIDLVAGKVFYMKMNFKLVGIEKVDDQVADWTVGGTTDLKTCVGKEE